MDIDLTQNYDLSTSLESPYKTLPSTQFSSLKFAQVMPTQKNELLITMALIINIMQTPVDTLRCLQIHICTYSWIPKIIQILSHGYLWIAMPRAAYSFACVQFSIAKFLCRPVLNHKSVISVFPPRHLSMVSTVHMSQQLNMVCIVLFSSTWQVGVQSLLIILWLQMSIP